MSARRGQRLELDDIQGNVLHGYRLPDAAYLLVRVDRPRDGRRLLRELVSQVTTASLRPDGKPQSTLNVAVSHAGLRALGVAEPVLAGFPPEFRQGMADRAERELGDTGVSHPRTWEPALRPIHLLLAVHARREDDLAARIEGLCARIDGTPALVTQAVQMARMLPGEQPEYGREHFGYSDGFAQPAIEGAPRPMHPGEGVPTGGRRRITIGPLDLTINTRRGWRPVKAGEFVLGYRDEDGLTPSAPAAPLGRNGTYMVYRKLEQDVVGFRTLIRDLARRHFSGDEELVAAKITGRWRDGTPLLLAPERPDPELAEDQGRTNDFVYRAMDPAGRVCPLGAHIRRANPRDGLPGGADRTRRHRIVRRGMPYGPPLPPSAPDDGEPRGLIFICFNASIARQFEVVNRWCMDGDAFGLGRDRDYLLGANEPGDGSMTVQGDPPVFLSPQPPLVTTRGGEYLFYPGLTALAALGAA